MLQIAEGRGKIKGGENHLLVETLNNKEHPSTYSYTQLQSTYPIKVISTSGLKRLTPEQTIPTIGRNDSWIRKEKATATATPPYFAATPPLSPRCNPNFCARRIINRGKCEFVLM